MLSLIVHYVSAAVTGIERLSANIFRNGHLIVRLMSYETYWLVLVFITIIIIIIIFNDGDDYYYYYYYYYYYNNNNKLYMSLWYTSLG